MTRYTVVWDQDVEVPFINAWIAGDVHTRAILTYLGNWLDANLTDDPQRKGEARSETDARQIDISIPGTLTHVSAVYQVLADDRQVRVVRLIFRRTS